MVSRFHSSFFTEAGAYESWAPDGRLYGGRDNGSWGGGGGRQVYTQHRITCKIS